MKLEILLPFRVFLRKDDVLRIIAETTEGSFGLLPHRLDCVAAMVPGILTFETVADGEVFVAIDEGVLVKTGGQEQRVAIARAIVTDPDLILADEPTGNLDANSAKDVLELLRRLNTEFHKTILMVTHDPHSAAVASRLLHLDKGKILEAQASAA